MIATLNEVLEIAEKDGNAVGMYNVPGLDYLQAVVGAAEELQRPVIIAQAEIHNSFVPLTILGPAMVAAAKHASVPVCLHIDHGMSLNLINEALDLGFTSIMIDASTSSFEENLALTKLVVDKCHKRGVSVEAELGRMPQKEDGSGKVEDPTSYYTNADEAAKFVEETNVDALAIAFGTAHGFYKQKPVLDFGVVEACRKATNKPLVMHGGSGVSKEDYIHAIKSGIRKINYYSYMSRAGLEAAQRFISMHHTGYFHDIDNAAMIAMKDDVLRSMSIFSNLR